MFPNTLKSISSGWQWNWWCTLWPCTSFHWNCYHQCNHIANIGPYLNEIYKREQYVTCFFFLQTTQCHIPNSWFCGRGYNFGYFWQFIKVHQNENHQIWKLLCKFWGQTFNFWSFFEDCKHEKRDDNSFMDTVLLIAHKKKSLLGHLQTKANLNGVKEGALKTFLNCTYPLTFIP